MPDTKRTASGVLGGFAGLVGLSAVAGVLIAATVTPAVALSGAAASGAITMFNQLPERLDIDKLMLPTTIYAKNSMHCGATATTPHAPKTGPLNCTRGCTTDCLRRTS